MRWANTRSGSVPFTIGESRSADLFSRQVQFADTLSWSRGRHTIRFGGSITHHTSGGSGSEPGQAVLEPASREGALGPLIGAAVCAIVGGLFLMILIKVGFA